MQVDTSHSTIPTTSSSQQRKMPDELGPWMRDMPQVTAEQTEQMVDVMVGNPHYMNRVIEVAECRPPEDKSLDMGLPVIVRDKVRVPIQPGPGEIRKSIRYHVVTKFGDVEDLVKELGIPEQREWLMKPQDHNKYAMTDKSKFPLGFDYKKLVKNEYDKLYGKGWRKVHADLKESTKIIEKKAIENELSADLPMKHINLIKKDSWYYIIESMKKSMAEDIEHQMVREAEFYRQHGRIPHPGPRSRRPLRVVEGPEEKARYLLRNMIGEAAFRGYMKNGFISYRGASGLAYQIFPGHRAVKVWNQGAVIETICLVFQDPSLPDTDAVIMRLLMLENNEEEFRRLAHVQRRHDRPIQVA